MTVMLLTLFVIIVIQLTSSQPTYDVTQQGNHVTVSTSCVGRQQELSELVTEKFDHLMTAVSQLQKDIKACSGNKDPCTNATTKGTVMLRITKMHTIQYFCSRSVGN